MLELLGKKYYECFRAGVYPQATITTEMLQRVTAFYSKSVHEAPVWRGHPAEFEFGKDEPEALAWVEDLLLVNDILYCSFSHVSEEMIRLYDDKKFKFVSVELRYYMINDVKTEYLYAIGTTNRPAVNGLPAIEFPKRFTDGHNFSKNFHGDTRLVFSSQNNFQNNSINQNDNLMNQFLIDAGKAIGLDPAKFTTESSLRDAIIKTFADKTAEIGTLQSKVSALEAVSARPENTAAADQSSQFTERVSALESLLFNQLADNAIAAGKILPAQKDFIVASAKADYAGTVKYVESLPVQPVLDSSKIKDGIGNSSVDLKDPKFTDKDGKPLTYSQVIKDDSLRSRFTGDELMTLKAVDPKYIRSVK